MEGTKKLAIPEGYEFDHVENGEVILKKKEEELPKTWEECESSKYDLCGPCVVDLPIRMSNAMDALGKLLACRNAWWKQLGWKPDWKDEKEPFKWCIHSNNGIIEITSHSKFSRILAFPTREIALEFYGAFKDLIKEAKELL